MSDCSLEGISRGQNVEVRQEPGIRNDLVCGVFAAWGLISAFAPAFRADFGLSAQTTAFLVAVPVLLGSVARIPMGMLTDRFGGRLVFTLLFFAVAAGRNRSTATTTTTARHLRVPARPRRRVLRVGVGFVSRWFPPEQQGTALGVYGLGNMGHSAAVFLGPVVASTYGRDGVFYGVAALCALVGPSSSSRSRATHRCAQARAVRRMVAVLAKERLSWVLSAFYFLTFGGFVAFSIYLPTLLRDEFGLTTADAGFRTAGFVVLATLAAAAGRHAVRPHRRRARALRRLPRRDVPFALLLTWPAMVPFTVGALGCAALLGLGNGAVFKLVPQFFPGNTATVTGLVGAMGGLGGFFPPLLLGFFRDASASSGPALRCSRSTSAVTVDAEPRVFSSRGRRRSNGRADARASTCGAAAARRRLGEHGDGPAGRRHRRRIAQPAELRSRAGDLHLRRRSSRPGASSITTPSGCNKPPTRRFFERTFELVAARGPAAQRRASSRRRSRRTSSGRPSSQALAPALVDAPAACSGAACWPCDHVSARLRLDPFRHRARTIR